MFNAFYFTDINIITNILIKREHFFQNELTESICGRL